jgi:hypothetical protein
VLRTRGVQRRAADLVHSTRRVSAYSVPFFQGSPLRFGDPVRDKRLTEAIELAAGIVERYAGIS